jgi:large subunit ribosomal protein L6
MSRVGKKTIPVPSNATVTISGRTVTVKGPLGELSYDLNPGIDIRHEGQELHVLNSVNPDDPEEGSALHGVSRAMVANLVEGVTKGFSRGLEIVGTGWRAALNGRTLEVSLGFAQPVRVPIPDGLTAEVLEKPPRVIIKGIRKDQVGQFAADIRSLKKPEPYLGKGIKYDNEVIRRKAGKSAG